MDYSKVKLLNISYFKAPKCAIGPAWIPPKNERIEIITDGEVWFNTGTGRKKYGRGYIFWHIDGEYTVHDSNLDFPYQCLVLDFDTGMKERTYAPRCSFWEDDYELRQFTDLMLAKFSEITLRKSKDAEMELELLGNYAFHKIRWEAHKGTARASASPAPDALRKAIEYIESNYSENIDVAEIARYAGISMPHLFHIFKKFRNEGPLHYINKVRMNEAMCLLVRSGLSIKEISFNCGFSNIESFYRTFKKYAAISPASYRDKFIDKR